MIKKTVIINRAVPGSGKTTITNCIIKTLSKNNVSFDIHSTDEFFMVKNSYIFDIKKLNELHIKNLANFAKSIEKGLDVVICDNTNIAPWQSEPYTKLARENGYGIIILTLDPRELEKHIESQKITPEKPDAHNVPENILKDMIKEYEIYDDLLDKSTKIDKTKHFHYIWDRENHKKVTVGLAKHFDSDIVIRILPNEYKETKKNIGDKILSLINKN